MIELGESALITLLILSSLQAVSILIFQRYSSSLLFLKGIKATQLFQFFLASLALSTLMYAYIVSDLSVVNVALNSRVEAPLIYKITGVWGNHEGSMILWLVILVFYGTAFSFFSRCDMFLTLKTLGIHNILISIFSCFVLYTSNPFVRVKTPFLIGQDLNPILQDPALAFHPPTLYLGLVGFSILFSLALAMLWENNTEQRQSWLAEAHFWTLGAWSFLTMGITMGSWWAYYELGWGGWWFWDPVENASLMPWLTATALIHVLKAAEKQPKYFSWSLGIALITFLFSLLGTFLVRSGALSSVHAFASDPTRGLFLGLIVGGTSVISLGFFFYRWKEIKFSSPVVLLTRSSLLFINVQLMLLLTFVVTLGTLYPLIIEGLTGETMTVGAPYFIATFVPLSFIILILMGFSGELSEQYLPSKILLHSLQKSLAFPFIIALGSLVYMMSRYPREGKSIVTISLSLWIIGATLKSWWFSGKKVKFSAMILSHLGMGIAILGMGIDTLGVQEKLVALKIGEHCEFEKYTIKLHSIHHQTLPTYEVERAYLHLEKNGTSKIMIPEKRYYPRHQSMTTETALHHFWFSNLYIALGGYLPTEDRWTLRIYYHPFVEFIWLGGLLMALSALGGLRIFNRVPFLRKKLGLAVSILVGLFLTGTGPIKAVEMSERLSNSALEERARRLSEEIKCPVCAGQSIDDSNVALAKTLRTWIRQQILAGKTDAEIRLSLVNTFGESVLFRPPLNFQNIILWIGPFLVFFLLMMRFIQRFRQQKDKIL